MTGQTRVSVGNGRLGLATDTSSANFTRDVGNGGPIAVEWNRTVDLSTKAAGSHQIYYGDTGYSYISNGSGQMYSARAQGGRRGPSHFHLALGRANRREQLSRNRDRPRPLKQSSKSAITPGFFAGGNFMVQ